MPSLRSRRKHNALGARSSKEPFDSASNAEVDAHVDPATADLHKEQAARSICKARLDISEWT